MKIMKRDIFSFSLAGIINLLILIFIPNLDKIEDVKDRKLKVGLVALEKQKYKTKAKEHSIPKEKEIIKNEIKTISKEELIRLEEKRKKEKNLSLMELSKTIEISSSDILTASQNKTRKELDSSQQVEKSNKKEKKLELEDSIGKKDDHSIFKDTELVKEIVSENIKVDDGKIEGLPSGYKLGIEDGDIIAKWDTKNKEPIYPEKAELRGMQGKVKVKLNIGANGQVINVSMEEGSGVPEIDNAIEKIARTWKIYLSKYGQKIKGQILLEYSFKLKGI